MGQFSAIDGEHSAGEHSEPNAYIKYEGGNHPPPSNVTSTSHIVDWYNDGENLYIKYAVESSKPTPHADDVYASILRTVIQQGKERQDRTQTGTVSIFGCQMRFDISTSIPLLTTKRVPWKSCIHELLWFLKGDTNAMHLRKVGVPIWDGNTTRQFLDQRGLSHLPEGDIGAGYGFQWRHFGATYVDCNATDAYVDKGFDQIQYIIDQLKHDPFSRRIFMSAWNPAAMKDMALPPCHVSAQFYVDVDEDGTKRLSCHMYQRSVDCFLGLPFNIMSYATLTYILCTLCDMKPHELVISTGDTHIYKDHIEQVKTQLSRTSYPPPILWVNPSLKDRPIENWSIDDFKVIGYYHHPALVAKMSV